MNHDKTALNGLIYIAFGYEYLLMAAYSAFTAKKYNPDISCTIVTNLKISNKAILNKYFDNVFEEDLKNEFNRYVKTNIIEYALFSKGAYLDCDTEVLDNLDPILTCLERYDVILKINPRPPSKDYHIAAGIHGTDFPMWNGGVIFFRNNVSAKKLFSDWKKYFLEMGKRSDQPALARAIYENPGIKLLSVNYIWNTFPTDLVLIKKGRQKNQSRIWHYRNPQDFPEVAKKIYQHHPVISASIKMEDDIVKEEIKKTEQKYCILSSAYYQSRWLRPFYLKYLEMLYKIGIKKKPVLTRSRHRTGAKFKKME